MMAWVQRKINRAKLLLRTPNPQQIEYVRIAVTYMCNSRCKHCNIWKHYKHNPQQLRGELRLEEVKNVFEESLYLGNLCGIDLTGGEPFLRKDIVDLCGYFIKRYPNAKITIPTNGLEVELIINRLEEIIDRFNPENLYISISLDGIEGTHDETRGIFGAYDCGLKLIEQTGNRFPSIKRGISFTVTLQNYKDLGNVYKLSRNLGIGFGIQFAQTSEPFYANTEKQFEWDANKLVEIRRLINPIMRQYDYGQTVLQRMGAMNAYYLTNMTEFQKHSRRIGKCYSGTHSLFINPYGDIFPCIMLNEKMGNIREVSFDEIWMSRKAQGIRGRIEGSKCACWTPCEIYPSLAKAPKILLWNLKRILGI